ncbi:MAG: hypothetical protein ABI579_00065 [Candidatus Sumerlaeota bacterium]
MTPPVVAPVRREPSAKIASYRLGRSLVASAIFFTSLFLVPCLGLLVFYFILGQPKEYPLIASVCGSVFTSAIMIALFCADIVLRRKMRDS